MCVLGNQKMKFQLRLPLPPMQAGTGQLSIKNFFFFFKMLGSCYLVFSHSSNQGERSQAKNAILTCTVVPRLSYYTKGKLIKDKKEIPHGIFFAHQSFSIFFREMPASK